MEIMMTCLFLPFLILYCNGRPHATVLTGGRPHAKVAPLYLCDMHNNMHIAPSFFPQRFLANSVPTQYNVWAVCIHDSTMQWNQPRVLPLRMRKT